MVNKSYNPTAVYVKQRRPVVDWMSELGESLNLQPETFHHAIGVYDGFLSKKGLNLSSLLGKLGLSSSRNISAGKLIQLAAVISLLISSKYLEKTYPGVDKLNAII
jgi:hypothetical protein